MTRAPLSGADLYDWIALRRVGTGGVAKLGDWWLEHGRRMPGYVTDALPELCRRELVTLSDPDPAAGGMARATLTHPGIHRYEQLCRQRQAALEVAAAQFAGAHPGGGCTARCAGRPPRCGERSSSNGSNRKLR